MNLKVKLISYNADAEKIITAAGKLCYSSTDIDSMMDGIDEERADYFVDMLIGIGHESVIEHASYTFAVEGLSRATLAQLTRHRMASFSVQSQRYVNMSDFKCVIPPSVSGNPEALAEFEELITVAKEKYNVISGHLQKDNFEKLTADKKDLSEREIKEYSKQAAKLANEDARFVLPMACETKIIMTMNARALYNFFKLRTCDRAQWEIRALAEEMLELLKEVSPVLFKKAGPPCVYGGRCTEGKMSCGKIKQTIYS